MTTIPSSKVLLQTRPLAACLAALCMTTADAAPALPVATPVGPASVVVMNCNDSGPGSLRDAAGSAISGDTIDLGQLTCSRISLTTGAIVFGQGQLALKGPGRARLTLDGTGNTDKDGLLVHLGAGTLIVQDLTLAGGSKYRVDTSARGGCIQSSGNVLLQDATVENCTAQSQGNLAALGGAIWASGMAYLKHSRIGSSKAIARGNGYASGGGVYALDGLQVQYSTIADNRAASYSSTPSFGGGAFARGSALILHSTVSGNQSARMGGLALADNHGQPATIINSTVSGNQARQVGGVYSRSALTLQNSTIAFNHSTIWDDGARTWAAGLQIGVTSTMHSSIVANNSTEDPAAPIADLSGPPGIGVLGNNNIIGPSNIGTPTDTSHDDPQLGPLQDNGGRTRTHLPSRFSWAVGHGINPSGLPNDQRGAGFPRSTGGVDIGAVQFNPDAIFINGFN